MYTCPIPRKNTGRESPESDANKKPPQVQIRRIGEGRPKRAPARRRGTERAGTVATEVSVRVTGFARRCSKVASHCKVTLVVRRRTDLGDVAGMVTESWRLRRPIERSVSKCVGSNRPRPQINYCAREIKWTSRCDSKFNVAGLFN